MSPTLQELGIDRLSVDDRIDLIGRIWDSLDVSALEISPPDWHLRELKRRRDSADADPGAGIPWEEFRSRLVDRP